MIKKILLFISVLLTFSWSKDIRLVDQYGISYAPIYVAKELGIYKKYIPNANITFQRMGGGMQ